MFINGTGNTIALAGNNETVGALQSGNTIVTRGGHDTIWSGGPGNDVNLGEGNNSVSSRRLRQHNRARIR